MKHSQLILLSLTLLLSALHTHAQDHLWTLNTNATGSTYPDSGTSSNQVAAELNNVSWQTLASGTQAVQLDGSDDSYVSFGNTIGQFGTQDFTVALWIQTTDNSLIQSDIIGNRADIAHGNFFAVRMIDDGYITAEVDEDDTGTNYIGVTSTTGNINDGQWHYLVITRTGTTLSIYIDNVAAGSDTGSGVANINNGNDFKLGRSLVDTDDPRFTPKASYHDVAVSNSAVNANEATSLPDDCWLSSYGRGAGQAISTCGAGQEQNGLLCYPTCSSGYTGVGPVCWQNCPSGFTDTGADCLKPASYGRGAGYITEGICNSETGQDCEQNLLLWYPKCGAGFFAFGCCVCSPECPSDMPDIGVSCQKNSYERTAGTPLGCASNQQEDAGLCYIACNAGYSGNGPVCWSSCPSGMYQCGALCVQSQADCTGTVLDLSLEAFEGVLLAAMSAELPPLAVIFAADTVAGIGAELAYPVCSS